MISGLWRESIKPQWHCICFFLPDGKQCALQVEELKKVMKGSDMPYPGDEGEERLEQAWTAIKRVSVPTTCTHAFSMFFCYLWEEKLTMWIELVWTVLMFKFPKMSILHVVMLHTRHMVWCVTWLGMLYMYVWGVQCILTFFHWKHKGR